MANHRSAAKAARQAQRRQLRNRSMKSSVKTYVKRAEGLISSNQLVEAETAVLQAVRALDRASKKGVLHDNNVARRKSRLAHKLMAAKATAASN